MASTRQMWLVRDAGAVLTMERRAIFYAGEITRATTLVVVQEIYTVERA